jgi:DNA invertase Pin-like site-specific DNA recombinase
MKEGKVLAYIRVSTNQQDNNNQKLVILEYASKNGMLVADFIEVELTSRRSEKDRRIEELLSRLDSGDT